MFDARTTPVVRSRFVPVLAAAAAAVAPLSAAQAMPFTSVFADASFFDLGGMPAPPLTGSAEALLNVTFDGATIFPPNTKPAGLDPAFFSSARINPITGNSVEFVQEGSARWFARGDAPGAASWGSIVSFVFDFSVAGAPGATAPVAINLDLDGRLAQAFDAAGQNQNPVGGASFGLSAQLFDVTNPDNPLPVMFFSGLADFTSSPTPVLFGGFDGIAQVSDCSGVANCVDIDIVDLSLLSADLVNGRRYALTSTHFGTASIFADGFESGDTSAWSDSVPSSHLFLTSSDSTANFALVVPAPGATALGFTCFALAASRRRRADARA